MTAFEPRQGQREILLYRGGRMGVSAVPGSGKTATIAALTTQLIGNTQGANDNIPSLVSPGERVLIVTYQTAAVDNLRGRIRRQIGSDRPALGFDVRTLHSLSYGLLKSYPGHAGTTTDFQVVDDRIANDLLNKAVVNWNAVHEDEWRSLAPDEQISSKWEQVWSGIATNVSRRIIAEIKNRRLNCEDIESSFEKILVGERATAFLRLGLAVYRSYQQQLETMGGLDFNDIVRLAVDLLQANADLRCRLGERWRVIIEDEAQDSIPLQENLLQLISQEHSNWIRVGDPNQAIMSSFTASDPLSLRRFLEKSDVEAVEMVVSGRCSSRIIDLANHLVSWACERHPVGAVKHSSFRQQYIKGTDAEDPQQNPAIDDSNIVFREYEHREEEFIDVVKKASLFAERHPDMTIAILVPTNNLGYEIAELLTQHDVKFDERLQISKPSRSISDALGWLLSYTASPLHRRNLQRGYEAIHTFLPPLGNLDDGGLNTEEFRSADYDNVTRLLRSCYRPETLVFPADGEGIYDALPPVGPFPDLDVCAIRQYAEILGQSLRASVLPVEQHLLTVAQSLFDEEDMARAQQLASHLRHRQDQFPEWRLPELASDLLTSTPNILTEGERGFEPKAGCISLTTMHRAKGLEWDLVYLLGVDGDFFHSRLEENFFGDYDFLGGDPAEMAAAALAQVVCDKRKRGTVLTSAAAATNVGHVELIAERLRLLYVGITRARRYLSVSWSRQIPMMTKTRTANLAAVFQVLRSYCMLKNNEQNVRNE